MIYIHVPFCRSFCTYCDFYSEIADDRLMDLYVKRLCKEINDRAGEIDASSPKTLYFGGGSPSVLSISQLTSILLCLEECGQGGPYEEFTLEANPEDIVEKGLPYLHNLKTLGVNRLSLGVQSFDDGLLRWMNRRHNAERAEKAFRLAREAEMDNISLDLIFGFNELSDELWEKTIDKAVELAPEHISCYQLSVEPGSLLAEMLAEGQWKEAPDEVCEKQYLTLCKKLKEAGYRHYEISNFAKPGYEAIHNCGYWKRCPYVGFGPSAHSFTGRGRSWNSNTLDGYVSSQESLSVEDEKVETLMLALRTENGVDQDFLYGNCREEDIRAMVENGSLVKEGRRYRIPEEKFFVSDRIIRDLI